MMCGLDEIIDIVYNGFEVIETKEAKAVIDLLDILDDKLLNSLVFKLVDNFGKIRIYTTDAEEKENKMDNRAVLKCKEYERQLRHDLERQRW